LYVRTILPAKLERNLAYLARRTFLGDLAIIAKTVLASLKG
jgi:lipopolysaccharide/colanic/teichoic acid biosynthesis glycosyltransferase